jgi:ribosomal protein S18 acetylase RimI-like enzyme
MQENIQIERAIKSDSRFIAEMIALSSNGFASLEWQQQADADNAQPELDVGAKSYAEEDGDYSYRNCWIARNASEQPVGMILSFALTEENCSTDAKPPPYREDDIYAPYKYLAAVNSWYICRVAVIPEYRDQDISQELILHAFTDGEMAGFDNISLIAMADKPSLIDHYQSLGFQVTRRAPIGEHPQIDARGEALLMETHPVA